jgi:hypothetical protein
VGRKGRTYDANTFEEETWVLVDCRCGVCRFSRGGRNRVWVCEHYPDGVECDCEEVSCEEEWGLCDSV